VTLTLNRLWSNISIAHRLIILDICAKLFVNPTRGSKDIQRRRNAVIQCLILDCDLNLEPTLVKHRHCTLSHHTWHLCKVICKSHQRFKRYRADTKAWRTDRRTEGQTYRQTDRQTTELNTICLPISWGGDIINDLHNYTTWSCVKTEIGRWIKLIKLKTEIHNSFKPHNTRDAQKKGRADWRTDRLTYVYKHCTLSVSITIF